MAADGGFSIENQTITAQDLQTLADEQLVNDKVINVYISLLRQRVLHCARKMGMEPSMFITSTHLYTKIGQRDGARQASETWFSKKRLLLPYTWVCIPVHHADAAHWSLLMLVNLREWLAARTDPLVVNKALPFMHRRSRCVPPTIVSLDSMSSGPLKRSQLAGLATFVVHRWCKELRDLQRTPGSVIIDMSDTRKEELAKELAESIPIVNAAVPQQENGHDCGVFLLHYLDMLTWKGVEETLNTRIRYWFLQGLGSGWFSQRDIDRKRRYLIRLLGALRKVQVEEGDAAAIEHFVANGMQQEARSTGNRLAQPCLKALREMIAWDESRVPAESLDGTEEILEDSRTDANGNTSPHAYEISDDSAPPPAEEIIDVEDSLPTAALDLGAVTDPVAVKRFTNRFRQVAPDEAQQGEASGGDSSCASSDDNTSCRRASPMPARPPPPPPARSAGGKRKRDDPKEEVTKPVQQGQGKKGEAVSRAQRAAERGVPAEGGEEEEGGAAAPAQPHGKKRAVAKRKARKKQPTLMQTLQARLLSPA